MASRTEADIIITPPAEGFPRATVTSWDIYRGLNGAEAVLIANIDDSVLTYADTGLPTNTPEHTFTYTVFAVSAEGRRGSNVVSVQWAGSILNQPTAPTSLASANIQDTSFRLQWSETADATVTKHGIFQGTTLVVNDIPANATSYTWSGRTPSTTYASLTVRRYNGWAGGTVPGWSTASNAVTVTTTATASGPLFTGHVPGQIYLGWSTLVSDSTAETQLNSQAPVPASPPASYSNLIGCRRLYTKNSSIISATDAAQRMLWISAKGDELGTTTSVSGWSAIASGSQDAAIVSYFTSLVARNKMTFFTFHHEPIGDTSDPVSQGTIYCNAFLRIMQVVDSNFPGHRIVFLPCNEEYRVEGNRVNSIYVDWARWMPESMCPGKGGPRPWDLIGFDMYQLGQNTSTNPLSGVQFSHRWWRVEGLFAGTYTPTGSSALPWMDYTPGQDITFAIGEASARPGAFYNFENSLGSDRSNMTGAKYARDMMDFIFNNIDEFACMCWFNSIGSDLVYNDERLYPGTNTWNKTPGHPSFVTQTGDTEIILNVYREKLASGLTVKLASNGLPPT